MRKELPKFFEQILNIIVPCYTAKKIFNKFHVLNVLSGQLDKVRARENKGYHEIFKRTKYLLLKNSNNLTKKDKVRLNEMPRKGFKEEQHLDTVQAYGLVLEFKKVLSIND